MDKANVPATRMETWGNIADRNRHRIGLFMLSIANVASYASDDPKACINCHVIEYGICHLAGVFTCQKSYLQRLSRAAQQCVQQIFFQGKRWLVPLLCLYHSNRTRSHNHGRTGPESGAAKLHSLSWQTIEKSKTIQFDGRL